MSRYNIIYQKYNDENKIFSSNYVSDSLIQNAGFGVFAGKNYKKGDTVEISPFIEIDSNNSIHAYTFDSHINKNKKLVMLGKTSLINHSENNNIVYESLQESRLMNFYAVKDIQKDEELYLKYGDNVVF